MHSADIIGVVHERQIELGDIKNRFGVQQRQIKITVTDGRYFHLHHQCFI